MHDGFDNPAGDELVQPHECVVARTDGLGRRASGRLKGAGERLADFGHHRARRVAFDHVEGVLVDDWSHLVAVEDEETDLVSANLAFLRAGQ